MNVPAGPVALIVEPDATARARTVDALTGAGFSVTATGEFAAARHSLAHRPPAVLIATLKLGEYNGLHLVLRARAHAPDTATLITVAAADAGFRKEVLNTGATFVVDPVTSQDLVAAVMRTLLRTDPTVPVEPPFERRIAERRRTDVGLVPNRRGIERRRTLDAQLQAVAAT